MSGGRDNFWFHERVVRVIQLVTLSLIWVFVIGFDTWIINLILLSARLHDVPSASVAISIVAIPVFLVIAGVLTFVYWGLHSHEPSSEKNA